LRKRRRGREEEKLRKGRRGSEEKRRWGYGKLK
jgi:hypothetical protein